MSASQRMKDLLESIELADQVGLDIFGLGEHHRPDFISSAPAVILAAAATRTNKIKLSSAVTVLSSDDPVRVYQDFATLDLISNGRAEIIAGRGSFIESFPLFGYDLKDYDNLFAEKLDLLLKLMKKEHITWSGQHRPTLINQGVYPRAEHPIPVWIAVGGTVESVIRAAYEGTPLALAIIGGLPEQFAPLLNLYRESAQEMGHDLNQLPISINSHGYIADTAQQARDESFPSVQAAMNKIGRERGWAGLTRAQFDEACTLRGAYFVGSPEQIIEKILYQYDLFHHQRLMIQFSVGTMPHAQIMHAIELFGTQVAPVVREEIAKRQTIEG